MYKQASKLRLRFSTTAGSLAVEQLWQLNLTQLTNDIKEVKKVLKKNDDDELSFLDDTQVVDVENQLRFDILKDVYLTKKSENEAARTELETKAHNQKILALIQQKREAKLNDLDEAELKKLLK